MFFQRYMQQFPAAGEIVIFDRSWYNRVGVEKVPPKKGRQRQLFENPGGGMQDAEAMTRGRWRTASVTEQSLSLTYQRGARRLFFIEGRSTPREMAAANGAGHCSTERL